MSQHKLGKTPDKERIETFDHQDSSLCITNSIYKQLEIDITTMKYSLSPYKCHISTPHN